SNGINAGYVSSEGYFDGTKFKTDLNADEVMQKNLKDFFASLKKQKWKYAVIEITSKNIEKKIYKGIELDSGVITNILGVEQLYGGWESYAATKLDFINYISNNGLLVINGEDKRVIDWISLKG